jgi:hypothetical protein
VLQALHAECIRENKAAVLSYSNTCDLLLAAVKAVDGEAASLLRNPPLLWTGGSIRSTWLTRCHPFSPLYLPFFPLSRPLSITESHSKAGAGQIAFRGTAVAASLSFSMSACWQ